MYDYERKIDACRIHMSRCLQVYVEQAPVVLAMQVSAYL